MPTLTATFIDSAGNPQTAAIVLRPLGTPQTDGSRLIGSGDVRVTPDSTGSISVVLAPGRYRLITPWDRPIELLMPNDSATHALSTVAPLTPFGVSSARTLYYGVSASTVLDAAGILGLSSLSRSSLAGPLTFPAGEGYYYFAFPDAFGSPAIDTGFLLGAFPLDMAGAGDGFPTVENGWSYLAVTVAGAAYRLYRTTSPQGGAQLINVQ